MNRNIKYSLAQLKNEKISFLLKIIQMITSLLIVGFIVSGFENNYKILNLIDGIRGDKEVYVFWDNNSDDYLSKMFNDASGNAEKKIEKLVDEILQSKFEYLVVNNNESVNVNGEQVEVLQVTSNFFEKYNVRGNFNKKIVTDKFKIQKVQVEDDTKLDKIAIVGSAYSDSYKVGDRIEVYGSSFLIIGFLDSNQKYVDPIEGKDIYSLNSAIISPIYINTNSFMDMYFFVYGCKFLVNDISELNAVVNTNNEEKILDTYLRSYSTQLEVIHNGYVNEFVVEGILGGSLLLFAFLGMLCTMIQRIVDNAYEYAVNLLCGARIWDIYARVMFEFAVIIMSGVLISVWVYGFSLASYVIVLIALICFTLVSIFAIKKIDFGNLVENIRSRG